ncbi:hypothetical protein APR12_003913 [Nocardia amikacinitolerans]|nr:hypothetical protein [Nocardia amikacinitolerans]
MPIRPLTFRELLDLPFALIQANIATLAGTAAAGLVAAEVVVVVITGSVSNATDGSDVGTAWAAILSTVVCAWFLRLLLRGVTVPIGLASIAGERIGLRSALVRLRGVAPALLIAQVLFSVIGVAVLVGGGILIITLPFAVVWLGYLRAKRFLVAPVLFAEHGSHGDAVRRTNLLVAGTEWPLTGLWLCQRCLFTLLAVPLLAIPWFVSDFSGTHRWPVIVLLTAAALLLVAFGEIVEASTRVVTYIDLRCRREGLDIRIPSGAAYGHAGAASSGRAVAEPFGREDAR